MVWLRLGSYSVVPPTRGGARSKLMSSRTALRVSGRTDIIRERCLGCGARREPCSTAAQRYLTYTPFTSPCIGLASSYRGRRSRFCTPRDAWADSGGVASLTLVEGRGGLTW